MSTLFTFCIVGLFVGWIVYLKTQIDKLQQPLPAPNGKAHETLEQISHAPALPKEAQAKSRGGGNEIPVWTIE